MTKPEFPICAKCPVRGCQPRGPLPNANVNMESAPPFCPMRLNTDVLTKAKHEYNRESVREFDDFSIEQNRLLCIIRMNLYLRKYFAQRDFCIITKGYA